MLAATRNGKIPAWYMKADVANIFVSINKQILDELLAKKITDPWWMELTRIILHKNPCENVYIKSPPRLLAVVPHHKSLLNTPNGFGLPIGNLSSQFFANVYLNELDQYAKHTLKLKYYARYVDDIVAIGNDGGELNRKYDLMAQFVKEKLGVKFHPNKKEINTVDHGVNFVGFIIRPFCKYIRRSTVNNAYGKISKIRKQADLRATVNSYFGMFRSANAYRERIRMAKHLGKRGVWFNGKFTKMIIREAA
jgi:retron-type reverse transcriptase